MGIRQHAAASLLIIVALLGHAQPASAQWMSLVPNAQFGRSATKFLEACSNLDAWPNVRSVTDHLGSFTADLMAADEPSLAACFSNMNAAGLKLSIEAAPFQPGPFGPGESGCGLAVECYPATAQVLNRVIALGMPSGSILIRMDEPYTKGIAKNWYIGDIAYQVHVYVDQVRANYPGIRISNIEAYPYIPANSLYAWQLALNNEGVVINEFEIDHNRAACCWSWSDIAGLLNNSHAWGWQFAYIFGSPVPPGGYWTQSALQMGYDMHTNGIVPDHYTFESWETNGDPASLLPEDNSWTFIGAIKYFRDLGFFPR